MADSKRCSACKLNLPAEKFSADRNAASGLRACCKGCEAERSRKRRAGYRGEVRTGPAVDFEITVAEPEGLNVSDTEPDPLPVKALDFEKLTDDQKTDHIVSVIPEVARANGIEPCDVTWHDFRAYTQYAWGESNVGIARRHIGRFSFNGIRDANFPPAATAIAIEKLEIQDRAKENRDTGRKETRDAMLVRQLDEVLARAPIKVMPAEGAARKFSDGYQGSRIVTSVWNDDHFAPECTLPGYDEAGQCRRVAKITQQHLEFKRHYREKTEARVIINGDMIENWLHGKRWAHPSVQAVSAAEKYSQVIRHVAAEFPRVHVLVVPGNHDRDVAFDPHRAVDEKAYGYTTIIAGLIRVACQNLKNVRLELASPEGIFDSFGSRVLVTHGDTVLGQVSPKKLNTTAAAYVLERFNAAQGALGPVKLVWMGHWHVDAHATTDSGIQIRFNPALTPSNEFARSIGAFQSFNGHYVYEETPGHPFGDNRLVRVTIEDSNDTGLDGLIRQFEALS